MDKKTSRLRRATRARKKLAIWVQSLVVNRTPRHIYAQLIAPTVLKCMQRFYFR